MSDKLHAAADAPEVARANLIGLEGVPHAAACFTTALMRWGAAAPKTRRGVQMTGGVRLG